MIYENNKNIEKKKICVKILDQIMEEYSKDQIKMEIGHFLQFDLLYRDSINCFKELLGKWIVQNFYELRQNPVQYFQYGKYKMMKKQTRQFLINYIKKCEKKIKEIQSYDYQHFNQLIIKNNLMQYSGYIHPYNPYNMVHGYPNDHKRYQQYIKLYNLTLQPFYLQNQPKYSYPINEVFISPQMRLGIPKHQMPKPSDLIKNHYCPFQISSIPTHPPNYPLPHQMPIPIQNNTEQKFPIPQKKKTQQPQKSNKNKYNSLDDNDVIDKKYPLPSQKKQLSQKAPFIISIPSTIKGNRSYIPQYLPKPHIFTNQNEQIGQVQKSHDLTIQQSIKIDEKIKKQTILKSIIFQKDPITVQTNNLTQTFGNINMCISSQYNDQLKFCLCNGYGTSVEIYICQNCKKIFHYSCTSKRINIQNNYQICQEKYSIKKQLCHFCFMIELDPLNKIQAIITNAYINNIQQNKFIKYINFQLFDQYLIKSSSQYEIQLRCMKLQDASNLIPEYTWPDQCEIIINSQKAFQFQALQNNSSLKKRKDTSMFLTSYILHCPRNYTNRNNLSVGLEIKNIVNDFNHKKIRNYFVFLLGIYLIRKKTPDQLCEEIKKNPNNKVRFAQKQFLNTISSGEEDVLIQQIKVNLMDPYTWNIIDIPARGTKCVHGQCFDLKTFLSFMNVQRVRQWKCPVCNKDCRSLEVDIQQLQALQQFKKQQTEVNGKKLSKEISFYRDGKIKFMMLNYNDDENDQKQSSDPLKTKLIVKDEKQGLQNRKMIQK